MFQGLLQEGNRMQNSRFLVLPTREKSRSLWYIHFLIRQKVLICDHQHLAGWITPLIKILCTGRCSSAHIMACKHISWMLMAHCSELLLEYLSYKHISLQNITADRMSLVSFRGFVGQSNIAWLNIQRKVKKYNNNKIRACVILTQIFIAYFKWCLEL